MLRDREMESLLLDYYGDLLTNHQKQILDEYFNEDLSMNEIAENLSISKSAVQDLIKRSLVQLKNYEKALKMIEHDRKIKEILQEMQDDNDVHLDKYRKKLEKIVR